MVAPVTAQNAAEASQTAVDSSLPIMKISSREETPVAAQKAVGAPPTAVEAGVLPGQDVGPRGHTGGEQDTPNGGGC
jgi:hypothetical protein